MEAPEERHRSAEAVAAVAAVMTVEAIEEPATGALLRTPETSDTVAARRDRLAASTRACIDGCSAAAGDAVLVNEVTKELLCAAARVTPSHSMVLQPGDHVALTLHQWPIEDSDGVRLPRTADFMTWRITKGAARSNAALEGVATAADAHLFCNVVVPPTGARVFVYVLLFPTCTHMCVMDCDALACVTATLELATSELQVVHTTMRPSPALSDNGGSGASAQSTAADARAAADDTRGADASAAAHVAAAADVDATAADQQPALGAEQAREVWGDATCAWLPPLPQRVGDLEDARREALTSALLCVLVASSHAAHCGRIDN
jgi:hypothetical protein